MRSRSLDIGQVVVVIVNQRFFVWSRDFLLAGWTKVEKNPAVKIGLS